VKTLPPLRELSANRPPPRVPDHELLRCIGRGSYGEVWLARTTLDTYRAVKVVYRSDFEDARPFEREYTGIRKFEPVSRSHEGLVDILQVGRNDQEGYFYYVMELADDVAPVFKPANQVEPAGPTLPTGKSALQPDSYSPRTLSAERRLRGRLPARECVALGVSLSGALVQLHRHGLIHRDIKPSNIIFVGGKAKLADIGLVTDETEPLSYVGTEGFIPPEGPNSPQADVFSLGKVLYEVSMGKDRLDFPEPATALEELPDHDELIELNSILLKACQPDRRQRYPSADEMHAELEMLHHGKSVREKRNREQRLRWMAVASVCVAAVTLAALGLERVLDWRSRALQGQSSTIHPSLAGKIAPRDAALPGELIDLSPAYTAPLTESWYPGPPENTLAALPRGLRKFEGISFDVRGIVQLSGGEISSYGARSYPASLRDIPIGRWVKRLHFLHGAVSEVSDGMTIGSYRIYYNTARQIEVPIVYGRNVRALWQPQSANGEVAQATVAWRGQNPATQSRGLELRLYRFTWDNPWPAEEIAAVDFVSATANAAPFLVAMTAEDAPLAPEQKHVSVNLVKALQDAAPSFPQLPIQIGTQPFQWSLLKLNTHPAEIGGRFYDGFRFTTPEHEPFDLVWGFSPERTPFQGWFILPMTGGLKVGFEDWYHGTPARKPGAVAATVADEFVVQFLSGKKLQPGREYFIWFGGETNRMIELQAALRFVPSGSVDPNQPADLAKGLGLPLDAEPSYHRHYCLGAIR